MCNAVAESGWLVKNRTEAHPEFRPGSFSAKAECRCCIKAYKVAALCRNLSGTADHFRLMFHGTEIFILGGIL